MYEYYYRFIHIAEKVVGPVRFDATAWSKNYPQIRNKCTTTVKLAGVFEK